MKNHTIPNHIDLKICLWHNFEMSKFPLYALSGYNKGLGIFYKRFVAGKAMGIIMNNLKFVITYFHNNMKIVSNLAENEHYKMEYEADDNHFRAKIVPKTEIELFRADVVFDYKFPDFSKFFGNGYQAWTTSKEYSSGEKMQDIMPIAAGRLRNVAGISADTRFVEFPKNAGEFYSHTYTYVKNENTFDFFGSLTEKQGFTVIYADMNKNTITFSKDVEGVTTADAYELFDMVMYSGSYDEVFDKYFSEMGLKKPRIDHMSGYTSWYNYFQKIDENIIIRDLNALDRFKEKVSIFQIDDGYETFVGDWLDYNPKKFPKGMNYIADEIHKKGYNAGIWLAPFNLQIKSRTYKEHPDWVIKENGRPQLGVFGWGGAYTMDIYNAEAREYIRHFFDVILNRWGYDMVKLDFLYSQCLTPRNNKSRGTIMCESMAFLRECCGDKLILGCGVPLGASFGYVDACRISCDVDLNYGGIYYNKLHVNNEIPSAQNAINNAVFRRHLNGRAFCNDPDVFFLRYSNLKFTMEQKLLLAGINHLLGGVLFVSDNAQEYKPHDVSNAFKFFSKPDVKILSADQCEDDFTIHCVLDGREQTLQFNIKTGKSNIKQLLDLK